MKKRRLIKEILLILLISFVVSIKFNPLKTNAAGVCTCIFYSADETKRKVACCPYPSEIFDTSQPCFSWKLNFKNISNIYQGSISSHQPDCISSSKCDPLGLGGTEPSPETAQICPPPSPPPEAPAPLDILQADLTARKPILQINIPGLKFSNVASSTDETGTYFYISWIPELISALYKFGIAIVSIVAVVMIIIQGITIASGGFISKTIKEGGKDVVISAYKNIGRIIVGLMIAWGSFAILYNINPALVQFNALKVEVVKRKDLPVDASQATFGETGIGTGNVPYFGQYESPWGNRKPGDGTDWPSKETDACTTIVQRGCGTTSLAMVLKFYNENVTPLDTAVWGLGCKGAWPMSKTVPLINKKWPRLAGKILYKNKINNVFDLLKQGKPIIYNCAPCTGYMENGNLQSKPYKGHYMVLTKIENDRILVNDPGRNAKNRTVWFTKEQIETEFKVAVYVDLVENISK